MELTIVRHGQSLGNSQGVLQGQTEWPLSELGRAQARATGRALSSMDFEVVVSSDLGRALETASLIAPGHDIIPEPRLREWNLGIWQGHGRAWLLEHYPKEWEIFLRDREEANVPQGENGKDVERRTVAFLEELPQRFPDKRVLVVTHNGPLRSIFRYFMGNGGHCGRLPVFANCSVSRLTWTDGVWQLVSWNESLHTIAANNLGND